MSGTAFPSEDDKPKPHAEDTWDIAEACMDDVGWLQDFEAALKKMLTHGSETIEGCEKPPCMLKPQRMR